MEPFNIKIQIADQTTTLTILPVNTDLFKVVFYGGILAGVRKTTDQNNWEAVPIEELIAGDLPFYSKDGHVDHQEIELNSNTINQIGQAIDAALQTDLANQNSEQ